MKTKTQTKTVRRKMETTALIQSRGLDLEVFDAAEKIATKLSKSSLLPSAVRGKPADLSVILLTGHELGLSPMQALRSIHVVEGRPVLSADLLVGLCKKHPACKYFRLIESTDEKATYETQREGEPEPTRITWTIQQATKAGLTSRHNWKAHPAAMLRARAAAALARAVYPDVAMGIYDEDEAAEFIDAGGGVQVEATAKAPPPPSKQDEEDVEDAVLVNGAADPIKADAEEPEVDEEDLESTWRERIEGAANLGGLRAIGKMLTERFPDSSHPIRLAMREPYAERQRHLRREEQG